MTQINITCLLLIVTLLVFPFFSSGSAFAVEYSLLDFARMALERAEKIKISEEDLFIAEQGKNKAFAALVPRASTFGGFTQFSEDKLSSGGYLVQPQNQWTYGVRIDQSFTLNGKEIIGYDMAKINIDKSRLDIVTTKETYLLNVASAFFDILKASKVVEIARSSVQRLTTYRDAASLRLKVGEVTKTDLLRAEAELSGARSNLIKAENLFIYTKAILARLVGILEDFTVREEPLPEAEVRGFMPLFGEALAARSEIKSYELLSDIAKEQISYAKGGYWPILSFEGAVIRNDQHPVTLTLNRESIYGGLRLTYPFFEGGLRKAEVREAEAKQRQAQLLLSDAKKTVGIEVENARLDLLTQEGVMKSLEDQVRFARENYTAVSKQYEFGLANSIDVTDANNLLVVAERQLADAVYSYQFAIVKMKRALGKLLPETEHYLRESERSRLSSAPLK